MPPYLLVFGLCGIIQFTYGNTNTKNEKRGPMLLRMIPINTLQLQYLDSLKHSKRGLKLQVWRHPDKINRHVDVWISHDSIDEFKEVCKSIDLDFEILSTDIYVTMKTRNVSMTNIEIFDEYYQKYDELLGELKRLTSIYKDTTTLSVIGTSYEGRDIYSVRIHKNNITDDKPIIFLSCGTHAREWLGIAACKHFLRKLLFNGQYDENIQKLLEDYDVMMIPLLNPDGYIFSRSKYRLWRKSRSRTSENRCFGVDLNRNFDYRWGGGGSSGDACEEIYCGAKPFSEKESLALARYLYKIRRQLVAYVDVHTYGQLWMSPWGYTKSNPSRYSIQERTMKKIRNAIMRKNNVSYKTGRSSVVLYQTSGDAIDWVYGRLGITHTYGIELRPSFKVRKGFQYTRRAIIPTGKDLLVGITTLAQEITGEKMRFE